MSGTRALRARAPQWAGDVMAVLEGAAPPEQAASGAQAIGRSAGAMPPAGWADGVRVPDVADLAALPPGSLAGAECELKAVRTLAGKLTRAHQRGHAALAALLAAVYGFVHQHRATPDLFAALAASSGQRVTAATRKCLFLLVLRLVVRDIDRKDASAYATALRYLAARGVTPDRVAEAIKAFGGMAACVQAERRRQRAAQKSDTAPADDMSARDGQQVAAGSGPGVAPAAAAMPRLYLIVCERRPDGGTIYRGRIDDAATVAQVIRHISPRPAILGPDGRPVSRKSDVPRVTLEAPVLPSATDKSEAIEEGVGRPGRRRAQARRPRRPQGGTEAGDAPVSTLERLPHEDPHTVQSRRDQNLHRGRRPGGRMRRDRRPGADPADPRQR